MANGRNSYKNQQLNSVNDNVSAAIPEVKSTRLELKPRVGRHHFALLRGYLEGLDLRVLAQRYLISQSSEHADLRIIRSILRWTIDELIVMARRQGRYAFAHAIDIEPSRIQTGNDTSIPSLDDFRAERDPDGFYGEAELLELFRDEYPGGSDNRKERRNARLRTRQNEALHWLETLVTADPKLSDALAGWFPEVLAVRLNAAGVITIEQLIARINNGGTRWFVSVPKIGKEAASRILTWLEMNQGSLKFTFGKQVYIKRSELSATDIESPSPQEGIVPLEYFKARPELDGATGSNRAGKNRCKANTDIDAIKLWLDSCAQIGGSTWLSYRREAERFLAWCVIERQKPLSSVDQTDCNAYLEFLSDLGRLRPEQWHGKYLTAIDQWVGRRGTLRTSEAWRPFDGASMQSALPSPAHKREVKSQTESDATSRGLLTLSSQRQAITILKVLFSWLMNVRYLDYNPLEAIKPSIEKGPKVKVDHSFTFAQWESVLGVLDTLPKDAKYYRLRFVLTFAYGTGLRLSELVNAKYGDLQAVEYKMDGKRHVGWMLEVRGKQSKLRTVPIPESLLDEIKSYMKHRGYTSITTVPADTYLIGRLSNLSSSITPALEQRRVDLSIDRLSARNLDQVLKTFFSHAHIVMLQSEPNSAAHILKASTNWLRHTCGSHAVASGVSVEMVRSNFGHESLGTTSMYIASESASRITAMGEFLAKAKKPSS